MKTNLPLLVLCTLPLIPLAACEKKTPAQNAQDRVDDALDRRPHEKIKDDAEDIRDDAKDAAEKAGDAVKEGAQETQDAAKKATE